MSSLLGGNQMKFAHELAKAATLFPSFHIFDEIPTCISDLIFNEMI